MNVETKNKIWTVVACIVLAWILIQVTLWTSSESTFHGAVIVVGMLAFIAIIAGLAVLVIKTLLDAGGGVSMNPASVGLSIGVPFAVAVLARSLNVPMGPTISLALASLGAVAIAINAPSAFPAIGRLIFAGLTVMVICSVVTKSGGDATNNLLFPFAWETDRAVAVLLTALGATLWASGNVSRLSVAAMVMLVLLFGDYVANRSYEVVETRFPAAIDTIADKTAFRFDRTTVVIEAPFILVGEDGKMKQLEEEQTAVAHFDANIPKEVASKFAGKVATFVVLVDKKTGMPIGDEFEGWVLKNKINTSPDTPLRSNDDTTLGSTGSRKEFRCEETERIVSLAPNEIRCGFKTRHDVSSDGREGWKFVDVHGNKLKPKQKVIAEWCLKAGPQGNTFCLS